MQEQKGLWIKMHEATIGHDKLGFRIAGLSHHAFQHHDKKTAKCMMYLQKASDPIDAASGVWRLWELPKNVERASVIHAAMDVEVDPKKADVRDEDLQRRLRNIKNPLSKRDKGLDDQIDEELKPARTGNQQVDQKEKADKEKAALLQARSK